jgi:hypothetical protein
VGGVGRRLYASILRMEYELINPDRAAIVPVEMAEYSGLTPFHVQVNSKYGGGFPANVEGLHHLHCLVSCPCTYFRHRSDQAESTAAVVIL